MAKTNTNYDYKAFFGYCVPILYDDGPLELCSCSLIALMRQEFLDT